ncbi:MAG: FecR domain-containing protein [Cyclobacteriaceae bacterium]|nr:FecR domain-containing protein [Cyclobacteriaceae bacterium HetDA_MAG_MS6]
MSNQKSKKTDHPEEQKRQEQVLESFERLFQSLSESRLSWPKGLPNPARKSEILYEKIQDSITDHAPRNRGFRYLQIAAAVALILGICFWMVQSTGEPPKVQLITKTTLRGQKLEILLNDGTTVKLNSESAITYPEQFDAGSRKVQLSGEAFFDVTRDKMRPFIVQTANAQTIVLGTSFNVTAFTAQNTKVTVASGRVKVMGADRLAKSEVILIPGMKAVVDTNLDTLTTSKASLEQTLAWKDGILRFDKISFKDAAVMMERWFNVTITFNDQSLEHCIIRGKYKNENLENVLESLRFVQGINYEFKTSREIIISGRGCHDKAYEDIN